MFLGIFGILDHLNGTLRLFYFKTPKVRTLLPPNSLSKKIPLGVNNSRFQGQFLQGFEVSFVDSHLRRYGEPLSLINYPFKQPT